MMAGTHCHNTHILYKHALHTTHDTGLLGRRLGPDRPFRDPSTGVVNCQRAAFSRFASTAECSLRIEAVAPIACVNGTDMSDLVRE